MTKKTARVLADNLFLVYALGVDGFAFGMTEPFYSFGWHPSDSAARLSWRQLRDNTRCVWWKREQ